MIRKYSGILMLSFVALFALAFLPSAPKQQSADVADFSAFDAGVVSAPIVEAEAALAENLLTGEILFSKNSEVSMPLASLTKIFTVLTALDYASLNELVLVSREAVATEGSSSLLVGEKLSMRDLIAMVMTESSNDAAFAVFEHIYKKNVVSPENAESWFLELMQKKAEKLGAKNAGFNSVTGLDLNDTSPGATGSASDMIAVAKAALNSEIWSLGNVTEIRSASRVEHITRPTNVIAADMPLLVGSKTGFTDLAGGNLLIIAEHPLGTPIAIVVLGSSEKGRFNDIQKIFEHIKSRY